MAESEPKRFDRRTFLRNIPRAVATIYLADQVIPLAERAFPTSSEIIFTQQQQARFRDESPRGVCLVYGGFGVGTAEGFTQALPALDLLGPVGTVQYSNNGLDSAALVRSIRNLQKEFGISEFSYYGQSDGTHIGAETVALLGNEICLKQVIMDDPPVSDNYVDNAGVAQAVNALDPVYKGGTFLRSLINWEIYGSPVRAKSASETTLWQEGTILKNGEERLQALARRVKKDKSGVLLLTPDNPEKDPINDTVRSEFRLRQIFAKLQVLHLGGNQGHANPDLNAIAYNNAILQALAGKI